MRNDDAVEQRRQEDEEHEVRRQVDVGQPGRALAATPARHSTTGSGSGVRRADRRDEQRQQRQPDGEQRGGLVVHARALPGAGRRTRAHTASSCTSSSPSTSSTCSPTWHEAGPPDHGQRRGVVRRHRRPHDAHGRAAAASATSSRQRRRGVARVRAGAGSDGVADLDRAVGVRRAVEAGVPDDPVRPDHDGAHHPVLRGRVGAHLVQPQPPEPALVQEERRGSGDPGQRAGRVARSPSSRAVRTGGGEATKVAGTARPCRAHAPARKGRRGDGVGRWSACRRRCWSR